jgi:hypothetical protein
MEGRPGLSKESIECALEREQLDRLRRSRSRCAGNVLSALLEGNVVIGSAIFSSGLGSPLDLPPDSAAADQAEEYSHQKPHDTEDPSGRHAQS